MRGRAKFVFVAVNLRGASSRLLHLNGHISQEGRQNGGFTSSDSIQVRVEGAREGRQSIIRTRARVSNE